MHTEVGVPRSSHFRRSRSISVVADWNKEISKWGSRRILVHTDGRGNSAALSPATMNRIIRRQRSRTPNNLSVEWLRATTLDRLGTGTLESRTLQVPQRATRRLGLRWLRALRMREGNTRPTESGCLLSDQRVSSLIRLIDRQSSEGSHAPGSVCVSVASVYAGRPETACRLHLYFGATQTLAQTGSASDHSRRVPVPVKPAPAASIADL